MGKDPETIEREIEDTRARMGERVDALSYKADVPSRVGDKLTETRQSVGRKLGDLVSKASDRPTVAVGVGRRTQRAGAWMRENPLLMAAGAVAAGVLVGLALPSTRAEDDRVGEAADEVKDRMAATGREALDRGREVLDEAGETIREGASRQAGELAESAGRTISETFEEARENTQGRT